MDAALRRLVWERAEGCCEYCRLPQSASPVSRFQIEHIRAKQHRGSTAEDNLALSCPRCNCFKGPNLAAVDPDTDEVVPIFHPRQQAWYDHFFEEGTEIRGLTATGRATVILLRMNDEDRQEVRAALREEED